MNFRAAATFRPADLVALESRLVPKLVTAVTEACDVVTAEAQTLAPVVSGALRESIHTASVELVGTVVSGSVVADAPHAQFVEFGTGLQGEGTYPGELPQTGVPVTGAWVYDYKDQNWPGRAAQPYMRPALDNSHGAIVDAFRRQGFKA